MQWTTYLPIILLILFTIARWVTTLLASRFEIARIYSIYFSSFAVGALLGNAFIHVLPHAFLFNPDPRFISTMMLMGVLLMFFVEKFMRIYTFFVHVEIREKQLIALNHFITDTIHSAMVGITIAASFMQSTSLGITTTIALGLITMAQALSSFTVVIFQGLSKKYALWISNIATIALIICGLAIHKFHISIAKIDHLFLPLGAGVFIYDALRKLIPEIQEELRLGPSLIQIGIMLLGIALMLMIS